MTEIPRTYPLTGKKIWVAGHAGMLGSALCRRLQGEEIELLTASRSELDLRRQTEVEAWLAAHRPDAVLMAAGTVGGIRVNDARPADFIYDNAAMVTNVLDAAYRSGVSKLLLLGSSCIYPKAAKQPIREDTLMTGEIEPTSQWYALAKIMGLKMCAAYRRQYGCDFIAAIPANIYGPGDDRDAETSHVIPAMIGKVLKAKADGVAPVTIWGTGTPKRDFLYVDDAADALVFLLQHYSDEGLVNIGSGSDISIGQLAEEIAAIIDYRGGFEFDTSMPDGMPLKQLDAARMSAMGWRPRTLLKDGLRRTIEWYTSS